MIDPNLPDIETEVIGTVYKALSCLSAESRERVLGYVDARLKAAQSEPPPPKPEGPPNERVWSGWSKP